MGKFRMIIKIGTESPTQLVTSCVGLSVPIFMIVCSTTEMAHLHSKV